MAAIRLIFLCGSECFTQPERAAQVGPQLQFLPTGTTLSNSTPFATLFPAQIQPASANTVLSFNT